MKEIKNKYTTSYVVNNSSGYCAHLLIEKQSMQSFNVSHISLKFNIILIPTERVRHQQISKAKFIKIYYTIH